MQKISSTSYVFPDQTKLFFYLKTDDFEQMKKEFSDKLEQNIKNIDVKQDDAKLLFGPTTNATFIEHDYKQKKSVCIHQEGYVNQSESWIIMPITGVCHTNNMPTICRFKGRHYSETCRDCKNPLIVAGITALKDMER